MARVGSVRQPDLVLITWSRNPLVPRSSRRIVEARVIGSARPCNRSLRPNTRLNTALACLLDNDVGFRVVFRRSTSNISGYLLLQRKR